MGSVFARIVRGELPSFKVAEDDQFFAFLDIRPVQPGHTLVVPKLEVDYFFDLNPTILAAILVFAQPIAQVLRQVVVCQRVGIVVAGLEVPHAHLHLIPIRQEADLHLDRGKPANPESLRDLSQAIRERLGESGGMHQ